MGGTSALASALLLIFLSVCHGDPEVTTGQGTLRGTTMTTNHGRTIYAFQRIPFGQPPIGDLRFKNPVAAGSWNGTRDATKLSPLCPQVGGEDYWGDEDCLYLDIHTPQVPDDANTSLLPVMVYFSGGKFVESNISQLNPEYILDKNVILVVPNYRLGALGFLSTGDSEATGNFGAKDMVLALKWVKENAKYFGGDSGNVTIFGSSSGASCVHFMTLSDLANGLFHKFIVQSSPKPYAYKKSSVYANYAKKLAEYLGCPTNSSVSLIACLRETNVSMIVNSNMIFYEWEGYPSTVWQTTDEPDLEGAFLTDSPANLIAAGKMKDLPCIIGVTRDEGLIFESDLMANETQFEYFMENFDTALPLLLSYHDEVEDVGNFTAALKEYYFKDLNANNSVLQASLTNLISDYAFFHPVDYWIRNQLSAGKSPFYVYSFEYRGTLSFSFFFSRRRFGASHADEIIYLFPLVKEKYLSQLHLAMSETDMKMVDSMVQLWTSFAINGKPTPLESSGANDWEPYGLNNTHLRIGNDSDISLAVEPPAHVARMEFWKELEKNFETM